MSTSPGLALSLRDAAQIVASVSLGKGLGDQIERRVEHGGEGVSRAALIDLTHGTLRRYGRMQCLVKALSHRAPADPVVEALLWCALYAIESGRYTDFTVVDQAVRAAGLLEKWNAKGYVNAVLRGYLRTGEATERTCSNSLVARYQHPKWWIEAIKAAYPSDWKGVLMAGNTHPPMTLRVNARKTSALEYQARLAAAGLASRPIGELGLLLENPVPVERLPGFDAGDVSVQDAGAQRAAACLDLSEGQRVLDACAAPGGKAAHVLERAEVSLLALDVDPARLRLVQRTFTRLGVEASIAVADCTQPAAWWDGRPFDRILADVPCTASGVARRHPDMKWLRRASDIASFASRQARILDALWQVLAPGGKLLYGTCSVFPQENDEVVEAFRARTPGARRQQLADGDAAQWLPSAEHDGFYYALIDKQA